MTNTNTHTISEAPHVSAEFLASRDRRLIESIEVEVDGMDTEYGPRYTWAVRHMDRTVESFWPYDLASFGFRSSDDAKWDAYEWIVEYYDVDMTPDEVAETCQTDVEYYI